MSSAVIAATVPLAIALPVVTRPGSTPHPVSPHVEEQAVSGLARVAAVGPQRARGSSAVALTTAHSTASFSSVGVTWAADPAVTDVDVLVRTHTGGQWTDWQDVDGGTAPDAASAESAGTTRAGTDPLWVGPSDGVQVRVDAAGRKPKDVRVALVDPGTSSADSTVTKPATLGGGSVAGAATTAPAYVSRAGWGANESLRNCFQGYTGTIKAAVVHNTATSNSYTAAQSPAVMRSMYAYHTQTLGWCDIGYQFVVDKFGTIFEGRYGGVDKAVLGAHTGGFNSYTFGVSSIGNHDQVAPTAAALTSIEKVIAWKFSMYGIDPHGKVALTSNGGSATKWPKGTVVNANTISGHRDFSTKSCPGNLAYPLLGQIRDGVASRLQGVSLSLASSTRSLTYGSSVALSGVLTDASTGQPLASRRIALGYRAAGTSAWTQLPAATTAADGTYQSLPDRPRVNTEYIARFPGEGTKYRPLLSSIRPVSVKPVVTSAISSTVVKGGTPVLVTGSVTPAHSGQQVVRQAYVNGAWQTWATATLSSTGAYTFVIKTSTPQSYTYRVLKKADADHAAAAGPTLRLRVY